MLALFSKIGRWLGLYRVRANEARPKRMRRRSHGPRRAAMGGDSGILIGGADLCPPPGDASLVMIGCNSLSDEVTIYFIRPRMAEDSQGNLVPAIVMSEGDALRVASGLIKAVTRDFPE